MRRFKLLNGKGWGKSLIEGNIYDETFVDFLGSKLIDLVRSFPSDWQEVLENESPWISVKDRLPYENGKVISYCNEVIITIFEDGRFLNLMGHTYNVTHWMLIPEPTKQ